MSVIRGTVASQMLVWDVGTLAYVPWDGSVTGATGGGGGGADVQYVEDAAAVANPTGTALAMVRADTLSALTSTNGDIVAARGTDLGELYVNDATAHTSLASIDTRHTPQVATGNISGTTPVVMAFTQPSPSTVVFINAVGHAITLNIALEGSMDGTTWNTLWFEKVATSAGGIGGSKATSDIASTLVLQDWGQYVVATGGMTHLRINPYNNPGGETPGYRIVAYPFTIARNAVYLAGVSGGIVPVGSDNSLSVNLNTGTQPFSHGAGGELGNDTLRVSIADGNAPIGAVLETAPATDTASSGLNGRLQRIAQRLTTAIASLVSIDGKTPAFGQTTMANSSPVVLASDQSDVKIANGAVTQVTGTLLTDTVNSAVTITGLANYGSVFARYVGGGGLGGPVGIQREATIDGTNWFAIPSYLVQGTQNGAITFASRSGSSQNYTTTDNWYEVIPVGYGITGVRYRVSSAIAAGSTGTVRFAASAATLPFAVSANLVGTPSVAATQSSPGTNLGAWWARIGDTTNGPVAVKAASTAAAATDPALVVRSIQLPAALGSAAMTNSIPVTVASDQSTIPVSLAGTQKVVLFDSGTATSSTVKAASVLPTTAGDAAVVVSQRDAIPAGTNVIGHVITDSGSTTAVTGSVAVTGPLTDTQIRATALPVSGTVTTSPPANASTNVAQLAGTATSVNSGVKDAGTLRVVLATDQPALTNKLLVTPDSVALPANQSVNVNQLAGTTPDVNSGTKSAGTLRVVLATDQPALTNKLLVTPDSVALPANQSVNVSQVNGVTTLTGTGATGTGAQRVTVAVDSATVAGSASLPTGTNVVGALVANQSVNNTQINGVTLSTGNGVPDTGTQRVFSAQRRTYSASLLLKTATAAGTGPFFSIAGSGTQTIRVQKILLSGTVATAAIYGDVVLKKTSTATSGGTATALTKAPHDSNSAAATATVNYYTVLATAGTSVGVVQAQSAVFPLTGTVAAAMAQLSFLDMNRDPVEAIVLRGTAQCLEMSFGTTPTNAPTLLVSVTWTEE